MLCHSGNCFSLLSGVHLILFGIVPTAIKRKPHVLLQRLNVGRVDSILFLFQYFPEIVDHNREFASDTKCSPHGRDRRSLWPRPFWALVYAESTRWSVCSRAERQERERWGGERDCSRSQGRARVRSSDTRIDLRAATEGHTLHQSLGLSRLSSHSRRCQRPTAAMRARGVRTRGSQMLVPTSDHSPERCFRITFAYVFLTLVVLISYEAHAKIAGAI